jgi:hypothetical protein
MSYIASATMDHIEQDAANWKVNNTPAVNPINFDYCPPPSIASGAQAGSLLFMASYSKNLAGGLISYDIPFPPQSNRSFNYCAINVRQFVPAYPAGTFRRNELDCKWTAIPATNPVSANQANGSTQINTDTGMWQLDPTGSAWVDSGYAPKTNALGQPNVFQIRLWSDLKSVWSVTGLQCNAEPTFFPGPQFQSIPLIPTNWSAGLHPQLQWEGGNAPFCATVYYQRVQVIVSEAQIPMLDPSTF